jgi:membrane-associated phospholipid phosphatase
MNWLQKGIELDARWSGRLRVCPQAKGLCLIPAVVAHSGDSWFWVAALGMVWLFNQAWRSQAAFMAASIVIIAALVLFIKFSIRRRRPEGEWGSIYRSTDPHSFPSGHATRAFLLVVLSWGMGPEWLAVVITIWAPLMSLSRVVMGVHYLSDIVAGMVIGSLAGVIMLQLHPLMAGLFPKVFGF